MAYSVGELCEKCAIVELNDTQGTYVWWHFYPEHCPFCELLLHCLKNYQGNLAVLPTTGHDRVSIYQNIRPAQPRGLHGRWNGHELQLEVEVVGEDLRMDYSIILCKPTPSTCLSEEPQDSMCFDLDQLRLWLSQCEGHGCRPNDHLQNPLPEKFRLIDVRNNCVISQSTIVDYCALSYVWGNASQLSLTSSNRFESPGSLDVNQLPRTIRDAMALCQGIGCPYLWVDSICIYQDSEDDKNQQIRLMANIYSRSFLTIIAAVGDDANAGLAPFRTRKSKISHLSRIISRGRSKDHLVATLSPQIAAKAIVESRWASRGWTVQEYALSRRVLFLTGSYAFLRCERGLRCEDFALGFSNCSVRDLKWDLPLPPFYGGTPDPDRHYSSTFSRMVAQYVRRRLSYDDDILAAFTGVLLRMEHDVGTHIWGLPSREFGVALQWRTAYKFPVDERPNFPSWTWAGWINDFGGNDSHLLRDDVYEGFDDFANISVLTCYRVGADKSIIAIEENNPAKIVLRVKKAMQKIPRFKDLENTSEIFGVTKFWQYFTPNKCGELEDYIQLEIPCKPPNSHHVFVWATCLSLYVGSGPGFDGLHQISLRDHSTRRVSGIHLDDEWRRNEPASMDFFISTVRIKSSSVAPGLKEALEFNLILIKLVQYTNPPIYKRIHVAEEAISLESLELANPQSRFIGLV